MDRAGFGIRLGAAILDGIILMVLSFIFAIVSGVDMNVALGRVENGATPTFVSGMISTLIPLIYTLLEIFKAATPGKMILKLRIANPDGSPADQATLGKRWAFKYSTNLLQVLAILTGIGLLFMLSGIAGLVVFVGCFFCIGAARQALHDKIANTAVFKIS